jgi:hypothetical protein
MAHGVADLRVEHKALQTILKSMIIHFIERGMIDPESLRALLDDAVKAADEDDAELAKALDVQILDIMQATYAAEPDQTEPPITADSSAALVQTGAKSA